MTLFPKAIAGVAQLIERCLAKAKVAGLNPVSRSKNSNFLLFCRALVGFMPVLNLSIYCRFQQNAFVFLELLFSRAHVYTTRTF